MGGYGLYVWGAYGVTARVHAGRAAAGARRHRARAAPTLRDAARAEARHDAAPASAWRSSAACVAAVGAATALVLNAFQSNLVFFYSPSQVAAHEAPSGAHLPPRRPGRDRAACKRDGTTVSFIVTDTAQVDAGALRRHPSRPVQGRQGRGRAGPARQRRRVRRPRGARQARRELHAARSRRGAEARPAGQPQARRDDSAEPIRKRTDDPRTRPLRAAGSRSASRSCSARCRCSAPRAAAPTGWRWRGPRRARMFALVALRLRLPRARLRRATTSRCSTSPPTPTARCRCTTASPAVWGGHEGSMLLWLLMLAGLDAAPSRSSAATCPTPVAGAHPRRDGLARVRLPAVHAVHLEPVRPPAAGRRSTAAT